MTSREILILGLLTLPAVPVSAQHADHDAGLQVGAAPDSALARQLEAVRKSTERYRGWSR